VHDLRAARTWGILGELVAFGLIVLADKGYPARASTSSPVQRRRQAAVTNGRQPCPANFAFQANARTRQDLAHAAQAPLRPWRAGRLAKAIHVLQARENQR